MSVDRKSSLARCCLTRDDHFVAISPTPPPFSAHIPEYVNPATAQSRQIETPVASLGIKFPFLVAQAPWWYVQRFREGHSLVMCLLPRLMRQVDIYLFGPVTKSRKRQTILYFNCNLYSASEKNDQRIWIQIKMSQQNGDNFEAFMFDLLKNKGSAELHYCDKSDFSSKKNKIWFGTKKWSMKAEKNILVKDVNSKLLKNPDWRCTLKYIMRGWGSDVTNVIMWRFERINWETTF